jgi:hypothetical protein
MTLHIFQAVVELYGEKLDSRGLDNQGCLLVYRGQPAKNA